MIRSLFAALVAASLAACAAKPRLADHWPHPQAVELEAVPFFPQREYQCGPAALATVLLASGVPVTADELTPQVFLPGREGSLQLELIAAARRYGRVPYLLPPQLPALLEQVADGRPVLLLQNLGMTWLPVWHYAVLVGFDRSRNEVVLRSGDSERRVMQFHHFAWSWERGGRWSLVVVAPDHIPGGATPETWIRAAAAFENLGQPQQAELAYRAATRRWPGSALAWLALGNARYAQHDLAGAEDALRAALAIEASAAAHNNLAQVLLERGCPLLAEQQVGRALALEPTSATVRETARAISDYAGAVAADCAR